MRQIGIELAFFWRLQKRIRYPCAAGVKESPLRKGVGHCEEEIQTELNRDLPMRDRSDNQKAAGPRQAIGGRATRFANGHKTHRGSSVHLQNVR